MDNTHNPGANAPLAFKPTATWVDRDPNPFVYHDPEVDAYRKRQDAIRYFSDVFGCIMYSGRHAEPFDHDGAQDMGDNPLRTMVETAPHKEWRFSTLFERRSRGGRMWDVVFFPWEETAVVRNLRTGETTTTKAADEKEAVARVAGVDGLNVEAPEHPIGYLPNGTPIKIDAERNLIPPRG